MSKNLGWVNWSPSLLKGRQEALSPFLLLKDISWKLGMVMFSNIVGIPSVVGDGKATYSQGNGRRRGGELERPSDPDAL